MKFQRAVKENLRFLVLEVTSLVDGAQRVLDTSDISTSEYIVSRDDYIDNLKSIVENKCFSEIFKAGRKNKPTVDLMKATLVVATNLERIADYAVNTVVQVSHYHDPKIVRRYKYKPFFDLIRRSLNDIPKALSTLDTKVALQICRCELTIDKLYEAFFTDILEKLRSGKDTEDLLTTIFIFRYLERIGDCLLNIGEAVLSASMGEKLKIHQFQALEESLEGLPENATLADVSLQSIWETRSGCRIGLVEPKEDGRLTTPVLFKQGRLKKLNAEKENIERWEKLVPGLPPKIFGFERHGNSGLLLLECFNGQTVEEMLFNADDQNLQDAVTALIRTIEDVWLRTKQDRPVNAEHFQQLKDRLQDVHRVHPEYKSSGDLFGSVTSPSFEELLQRASPIAENLQAPFSVLIHGDFNVDNIIYDSTNNSVHFIDLHRSRETDYVQDVAVFMISNFRIPVSGNDYRSRLNWIIAEFFNFARGFAKRHHDDTFEARLTLGLIRSFVSSTRFELKEEFANSMYLRAMFLLEKLIEHDGRGWSEFRLPQDALAY